MPNYFYYISESAAKYDEPEFIEESVTDSFNETIADMDLYCFQESLVAGAIIVGAVALIGLLIVLIKKIINGSSSSDGMKKQATKMEKVANDLSKKGVKEIRTGSAATQYINSSNFKSNEEPKPAAQTEKPKSNVIVIEEVLCDASKEFVDILDTSTENTTFIKAIKKIWRFAEGTIMYFEYAIAKKSGAAHKSAHMPDKWRNQTDKDGNPKYEMVDDFKYDDIFKPLDLPLREMNSCLVRKNIYSIDALRDTAGKIKSYLIPETQGALKRLEATERKLKRYGEDQNNTRAFQNKYQEQNYRKNVADSNKFITNIQTMNTRTIMWLEKCNGSARFVGVGA